jgi:hypothetical protein
MREDINNKSAREEFARTEFAAVADGLNWFNAFGKLRIALYVAVGAKGNNKLTLSCSRYVEQFNQAEAEAILQDERQIARHAMIIKLTRL